MPYTLSALQDKAFTDTFDFYKPTFNSASGKKHEGVVYTLAYSGVKGRIQAKPESLQANDGLGRTNRDQIDTTDLMRVHTAQEVGTTYYVKLVTPGHPEENSWYAVLGDARNQQWRAKTAIYFLTKTTAPLMAGLSEGTFGGVVEEEIIP